MKISIRTRTILSFIARKIQRDTLLRSIDQAARSKKLEYLLLTLRTLKGWGLAEVYVNLKEQAVMLAPKYQEQLEENFIISLLAMDANGHQLQNKDSDPSTAITAQARSAKLRQAIAEIILGYSIDLAFYYHPIDIKKSRLYAEIVSQYSPVQGNNLRIVIADLPAIWRDYLQPGKWQAGLQALKEVLAKKPQGDVAQQVYYLLSGVEYRLGQKEQARSHLHQAEKEAPATALALRIRKIIACLQPEEANVKKRRD